VEASSPAARLCQMADQLRLSYSTLPCVHSPVTGGRGFVQASCVAACLCQTAAQLQPVVPANTSAAPSAGPLPASSGMVSGLGGILNSSAASSTAASPSSPSLPTSAIPQRLRAAGPAAAGNMSAANASTMAASPAASLTVQNVSAAVAVQNASAPNSASGNFPLTTVLKQIVLTSGSILHLTQYYSPQLGLPRVTRFALLC